MLKDVYCIDGGDLGVGAGALDPKPRRGDFNIAASGRKFWTLDPRVGDFDIQDIAHSLANQCRFVGHTRVFYSVAQHSIHVSQLVPERHALAALLHDAAEAYLGDMSRPLKHQPEMAEYRRAEDTMLQTLAEQFGFEYPLAPEIHKADEIMLGLEALHLMPADPCWEKWIKRLKSSGFYGAISACVANPLMPSTAKAAFLARYNEIIGLGR